MTPNDLQHIVRSIVRDAKSMVDRHTDAGQVHVNYACVFAHSDAEYADLDTAAHGLGPIAQETKTGNVYHIAPLETEAGELRLVKIRKPDPTRTERGDADFTVFGYERFKDAHVNLRGFSVIERPQMEMVEFVYPGYDVRAYFSNPTLLEVLKLV